MKYEISNYDTNTSRFHASNKNNKKTGDTPKRVKGHVYSDVGGPTWLDRHPEKMFKFDLSRSSKNILSNLFEAS